MKSIQEKVAYIAGWGLIKNKDCFTGNFGPERNTKCRPYFIWKKRVMHGCIKTTSPSLQNKRCRQFKKVCLSIAVLFNMNKLKTYMKFQMITFHHFSQIERCIRVLQVKPLELITAEAKDM